MGDHISMDFITMDFVSVLFCGPKEII